MCAYNAVDGTGSCESKEPLTDVLRTDWGFSGYVRPDFFAAKTTVAAMKAGMDHEMPQPIQWSPSRIEEALAKGACAAVDGRNPCVAFPFGHGLSYTTFAMGKPTLSFDRKRQVWHATTTVTNTGSRAGSQVVQAYLGLPASASQAGAPQPPKRLVGFQKVELAPGHSKRVAITIDPASSHHPLGIWDEARKNWITPAGQFTVWLGTSSAAGDLAVSGIIQR
ncbi:MAG: glycoside hydrolase family 3 protein [Pseudomonas sp.]|nr:MAG: glycoside hydrolase family 3 protein [Pseudomonas sp.]